MGLDQYLYTAKQANSDYEDRIELAYRRKHPNLHGYMQKLYNIKHKENPISANDFNCVELELNINDIYELKNAIERNELPLTEGFFFGDNSDEYYKLEDMKFIELALKELDEGNRIFYNSYW